jgi:hypothetical protein
VTDAVILRRESIVTLVRGDNRPVVNQVEASIVVVKRDGVPGIPGPQGPEGNGVQTTFQFSQPSANQIWNISHNLNRYPSVTVVDNAGRSVLSETTYLDPNLLRLEFDIPMSGIAYLN